MASERRPRYRPPQLSRRGFASTTQLPRWFMREAVPQFELTPYDIAVFLVIADNLDGAGVSTTAVALIAERTGMSRNAAAKCIDILILHQLLFELDPRQKGRIMRYAIPPEMPWGGRR